METLKICALCQQPAHLLGSHILPAFIFRDARKVSTTGYFRSTVNPNQRLQDGPKLRLLCADCEAKFCQFEAEFSSKLYYEALKPSDKIEYSDYLIKFCTSISWRILKFYSPNADIYSETEVSSSERAELKWRNYLMSVDKSPGEYEQYIFYLGNTEINIVDDVDLPLNQYLRCGIDLAIVNSDQALLTYAKFGNFALLGKIKGSAFPRSDRVGLKSGYVRCSNLPIPLAYIFRDRAELIRKSREKISGTQSNKIIDTVKRDLNRVINSRLFQARLVDEKL